MKKNVFLALCICLFLFLISSSPEETLPVMQEIAIPSLTSQSVSSTLRATLETSLLTSAETTVMTTTPSVVYVAEQETPPPTMMSFSDPLSQTLYGIFQKYNTVGMSVAVFKGQDILYTQSFGYADLKNAVPATDNTKYRVASVSKTITGILAMQLAAEGKLNLDADISDYMGLSMRSPSFPGQPITARHLMTHTSGIVDSPKYEEITDGYVYPTLPELMSYGGMYTSYAPGTRYIYSNLAYGLLCGVIEGVTQERFYTVAKHRLFEPLGINAGYLRTQLSDPENIALIYENHKVSANPQNWGRVETAYDSIPLGQMYLLGYGDLFITAQDLAKFGILLAGDGSYQGTRLLPPEPVSEMNSLQFETNKIKRGLALSISDSLVPGRRMYGHPGQSYGMVSGMYYDPTDSTGVVLITNGCTASKGANGIYSISDELVKAVYAAMFS